MDLEQQVKQLRTRINALREKLNTDNTTTTTSEPEQPKPKPSAAELYKAQLLKKSS